jgi:hypothetical protein
VPSPRTRPLGSRLGIDKLAAKASAKELGMAGVGEAEDDDVGVVTAK